jgi:hypothetical protein
MKDADKRTPMHLAAIVNSATSIKILAQFGADLNCANKFLRTPLHYAAQAGSADSVRELLQARASLVIDKLDAEGSTPLGLAIKDGHRSCALALVKALANVNLKMPGGKTPLDCLKDKKWTDVLEAFGKRRVDDLKRGALESWLQTNEFARSLQNGTRRVHVLQETDAVAKIIASISSGECDLSQHTYFDGEDHPHRWLFRALACATNPSVCEASDIQHALQQYEKSIAGDVNAWYYIVSAHLARASDNLALAAALIDKAKECGGSDLVTEIKFNDELLKQHPVEVDGSSGRQQAGEQAPQLTGLQRRWHELKQSPDLGRSPDRCAPMEKLLGMTGIDAVKSKALDLYESVLSAKALQEKGYTESANNKKALNFAFVGNPGTTRAFVPLRILQSRLGRKASALSLQEPARPLWLEYLRICWRRLVPELATSLSK